MEEMEKGLAWLDEAIYLGKKVLIHCRHGIGRTGTFLTSYLLRKGLGLKLASKKLKHTRAAPTNYSQWRLLKKYGKKSGVLKIREPSLESKNVVDLSAYFTEYEALIQKMDDDIKKNDVNIVDCGIETNECCFEYFEIQLVETIYLYSRLNRSLPSNIRSQIIHNAVEVLKTIRHIHRLTGNQGYSAEKDKMSLVNAYNKEKILCPLQNGSKCMLYKYRPIRCRYYGIPDGRIDFDFINKMLFDISRNVFFAFSGFFLEDKTLSFSLSEIVSGRFVQDYFYYLASLKNK
jgi:Fe-S-cluster containining protein